jgi:small subunit ribosomal protein S20
LAHHTAAKKAIKQSAKHNIRNRTYKSKIKTAIKQLENASGEEEKKKALRETQKIMDRAAQRNVISRKSASRKIAKLTKKQKKIES